MSHQARREKWGGCDERIDKNCQIDKGKWDGLNGCGYEVSLAKKYLVEVLHGPV